MIDLQCNGAFGIDLLKASYTELDALSQQLLAKGTTGFTPTIISSDVGILEKQISVVGSWVNTWKNTSTRKGGAVPLGIHLEGPFINPEAAGIHPKKALRQATIKELDRLWKLSDETIRIITIAPEIHEKPTMKKIIAWANEREVRLSLGHSRANYEQARSAFDLGMHSITHAWNASQFHHRDPGAIGAALGRDDVYVQVIIDQIHVHPAVIRWTLNLHAKNAIGFVSDCAPSAEMRSGTKSTFGDIKIQALGKRASLLSGEIAGSGQTLASAWKDWVVQEAKFLGTEVSEVEAKYRRLVKANPLRFLNGDE